MKKDTIDLREANELLESKLRHQETQLARMERELQIETALEKVRSRSLTMHHSTELEQVAGSLFDRLAELGLSFDGALIFTFDKDKRNINLWIATNHLSAPVKIDLPYDKAVENNTIIKDLWNAIETGQHIIDKSYSGEVKNEYFRYVAKYNEPKIPESIRQIQIEKESWTAHFAAEKNSMIGFDSWSGHPTTDEDFQILIRFAKVFEQAYTRFLDLQKAEAQAHESQIQLGLERVRARAMAMHNSEELKDVVTTLFEKLKELGLVFDGGAGVKIFKKDTKESVLWVTDPDLGSSPSEINLPYVEKVFSKNAMLLDSWNARETGTDLFNRTYSLEEKNEYFDYVFSNNNEIQLPQAVREWIKYKPGYTGSEAYEENTAVVISSWSEELISKNQMKVLKRFARVFEQAYTRFLDIQKAEA